MAEFAAVVAAAVPKPAVVAVAVAVVVAAVAAAVAAVAAVVAVVAGSTLAVVAAVDSIVLVLVGEGGLFLVPALVAHYRSKAYEPGQPALAG